MRAAVAAALGADPGIEIVGTAADGPEAIELARSLVPDVLVLDLALTSLSGLVVLERIRQEAPSVRALVLSGVESAERAREAFAAGAAGYLCKSAEAEEVRQAVITLHGGGSVIAPHVAAYVLRAYSDTVHGGDSWGCSALTEREQEIVRLVADGRTDSE